MFNASFPFWGTENASDGRYPPGSKSSCSIWSSTNQVTERSLRDNLTKKPFPDGSPASTAMKRSPLCGNRNKVGPAIFQKLERKKPSVLKVEIAGPTGSSDVVISDDSRLKQYEQDLSTNEGERKQFEKPVIKRALFKGGSRVVPCGDDNVVVSNETGDICRNKRDCDDISLIRKQLLQIENQQSNLLDLLQVHLSSMCIPHSLNQQPVLMQNSTETSNRKKKEKSNRNLM